MIQGSALSNAPPMTLYYTNSTFQSKVGTTYVSQSTAVLDQFPLWTETDGRCLLLIKLVLNVIRCSTKQHYFLPYLILSKRSPRGTGCSRGLMSRLQEQASMSVGWFQRLFYRQEFKTARDNSELLPAVASLCDVTLFKLICNGVSCDFNLSSWLENFILHTYKAGCW